MPTVVGRRRTVKGLVMQIRLIDGVGPFFRGYKAKSINWSKAPFDNLEKNGELDKYKFRLIREDFKRFVNTVSDLGFNSISVDDLAHMVDHKFYPEKLRAKLRSYRDQYVTLFEVAGRAGMDVYVTTDIMFYNKSIARNAGTKDSGIIEFLVSSLESLFETFPQVKGVITRIGECDGVDVEGDFRSRLVIRKPSQARAYIERLLPVFEKHERNFIFRTWTVGAYKIGDLAWNRDTFDQTFKGVESDNFVISMKYGETDFFRFLPLNKLFFQSSHRKIVELQARREYEGFGEYPSFIGRDYESYRDRLKNAENMVGFSVWCQTGGWGPFGRLTFLENSSLWNEVNTYVTLKVFGDGMSAGKAARDFYFWKMKTCEGAEKFVELLDLSDQVVKDLLYLDDFAVQKIFFRRLRVPPLLSVYWDQVLVNHCMRKLLKCFVSDREGKIKQGYRALKKINRMIELASDIGLDSRDLHFERDTFRILAMAREYYFRPFSNRIAFRLEKMRDRYEQRYQPSYSVDLDFSVFRMPRSRLKLLLALVLRRQRGYRMLDRLLTINLMSIAYTWFRFRRGKAGAGFAENRAMGIGSIFK